MTTANETPVRDLTVCSDGELSELAAAVAAEQHRRAVRDADPDALAELGFADGFKADGLPRDPFFVGGVVVCPGARNDRSATGHDCGFVSVGERWVWDADEVIVDVVRHPAGPRPRMRSVTLLAGHDGLELDLVVSRARAGVHQMRNVRSFVLRGGQLELVGSRTPKTNHHR